MLVPETIRVIQIIKGKFRRTAHQKTTNYIIIIKPFEKITKNYLIVYITHIIPENFLINHVFIANINSKQKLATSSVHK
jgi:hypothetical protein